MGFHLILFLACLFSNLVSINIGFPKFLSWHIQNRQYVRKRVQKSDPAQSPSTRYGFAATLTSPLSSSVCLESDLILFESNAAKDTLINTETLGIINLN